MTESTNYRMCSRCILDTNDDKEIVFDEHGVCHHCHIYTNLIKRLPSSDLRDKVFAEKIDEIKEKGRGKAYDCLIGLSGGADSSYVAWVVKQAGLRPLALHLDNGWNSELSVNNIQNIVRSLDIDLFTHVIDWEEFKDLQRSFFKAGVIDIELLTDHAIVASMYKTAVKFRIPYIITGENILTEGRLPGSWVHFKNDLMNIRAIQKQFGTRKIRSFPVLGVMRKWYCDKFYGIRHFSILDYIDYQKETAKEILATHLKWRDYEGKHFESVFTRFYQSCILPRKFGVDKRKSHYSTLICAGQLTRDNALELMKQPVLDEVRMKEDFEYVCKKLGFTIDEMDAMLNQAPVPHTDYSSFINVITKLRPIARFLKNLIGKK